MKFKQAVITYWFCELEYNPISKVGELESNLGSFFKSPFLINEQEPFINIGMPRIIANGINNDINFSMSLVNMNLNINLMNFNDIDDIVLKINELSQTLYDVLSDVYDLKILYASIKIEVSENIRDKFKIQKEYLLNNEFEYEDFLIKTSFGKDNKYYINNTVTISKEVKIDIKMPNKALPNEADMLTRSMLVSLDGNNSCVDVKNKVNEINNRLSYNLDKNFYVSKDELRDLLFEFKMLINHELKKWKLLLIL